MDAAQYGSADLAIFMLDWQFWRPYATKDSGARGAAGVHTFQVRAGFSGPLSLYPIEAIDPDDGTVSLSWNIWSDDPVLIDGAAHPTASPVSGSSSNVQPQSWLVETPPVVGSIKFRIDPSSEWKEFEKPQRILYKKETQLLADGIQPDEATFPSGSPVWEGTYGVTASGVEVSHLYSGQPAASDDDAKTVTTQQGPDTPEEFLICHIVLGIHSNVEPETSTIEDWGHAWISITDFSFDSPVTITRGLWPDGHKDTEDNGPESDVRDNLELTDTGRYNRYYLLSPSEYEQLLQFINTSDDWTIFNTCANWAEKAVQTAVGETVDSKDGESLYAGTPRKISESIRILEMVKPTHLDKPLYGGEDAESTSSGDSSWGGSSFLD